MVARTTSGEAHPSYILLLNNLAQLFQALGRYAEAEELMVWLLDFARNTLGEEHPNFATRLNNLANAVVAQGRYAEARKYYFQAMGIYRATLGDAHPLAQQCAHNSLSLLQAHFPNDPEIPTLKALLAAPPAAAS